MRFKAKPKEELTKEMVDEDLWYFLKEYVDDDGFIHGWYSDGFIIGHVIEADDEYIIHEFWCPVDKTTLQLGKKIGE